MTLLFITTADTEILALRSIVEALPKGFDDVRAAKATADSPEPSLEGVSVVLVRLLGGRAAWAEQFDRLRQRCVQEAVPLLAFGGEAEADAELTALSTVPTAVVSTAFDYLVQGGLANTEHLLRFVADTVLMEGFGFDPPVAVPEVGIYRPIAGKDDSRPRVVVIFYRAHLLAGNLAFVDALCDAIEAAGGAAAAIWCYSLRPDADGSVPGLDLARAQSPDAVVTTVLASGLANADGTGWEAPAAFALGVPVLQAIAATTSAAQWSASTAGLGPIDVAMSVAIPELDGRIITVPTSFKENVEDDVVLGAPISAYRVAPDRVKRVAGIAVRTARLARRPVADRRVAIVLSAYPTKRSRIGNAVGLDTPASLIGLLQAFSNAGYTVGPYPASGDEVMGVLADSFSFDSTELSADQVAKSVGRWSADDYRRWWAEVPPVPRHAVEEAWGPAPGRVQSDPANGDLIFGGIEVGHVLVAVQPPRGFGENPVAVYHSPDLAPTHHYLGFYRWLDQVWGADAVIHLGKHGTLEWLPGKGVGLSEDCYPDLALGDLPLVYPFVVNDPGEGIQAKRRAHAVIVDHLCPPMTRAESYDDTARLEQLLDEHAQIGALDPTKLSAIRTQVWELLVKAEIHRDLGLEGRPGNDDFDELILHVDGYLCELKDAQIRGGLHVLGHAPEAEAELDMVLALTRLAQGSVPSLRETMAAAMGIELRVEPVAGAAPTRVKELDALEAACRRVLSRCQSAAWSYEGNDETLRWVCSKLVPALRRTPDELSAVVSAVGGAAVPAGPAGAPTRGMAHVLPTGRNFYSVDPRSVPSRLAWDVGRRLAEELVDRHVAEEGRAPSCVGLVVWGTAAMRTGGDDVALALALLGVRPVWAPESPRIIGLELIAEAELGRPRVDVVLRISGFFRDAFPALITLFDDAVHLAGFGVDGDPRIFGAKPGAYGSGMLPLLESRAWRDDADLAEVYTVWGGYSYGRDGMGVPAVEPMRRRFAAIEVALKNQDNREHDIFDSDDYLQDHGGMVATIRALTGSQPKAWFGDTADPSQVRMRSLAEEAARVVRTRVINPKWIGAMRRHGYKGAFELAATVDYLFGYDATARVVEDWMYERVTEAYVADAEVRKFFETSNPSALRSIVEKLFEAAERNLWSPSAQALATLRQAMLETEGWEESGSTESGSTESGSAEARPAESGSAEPGSAEAR